MRILKSTETGLILRIMQSAFYRLPTREVKIGNLLLGNGHPIRIQTMTTTDTMDTAATVAQTIRCIEAGAELVRITAPSKKEAENLQAIKDAVRAAGYDTPLVADIHFTPNAAEIAARIIEKVRINPGNYVDKKKFDQLEYTDEEYAAEIERIRERFMPLVRICKEYGTAMRIGTNHGSLSDRIMSRYGDTALGMVESAMEFLRIARSEDYHQIILSMKSSNPQVMVQAYRLLVQQMQQEFGECYPLHLGVTEAGDGEDGRIKSAIGIGTLLEEGIGDTVRVSLTEDPEFELPVCKDLVRRYNEHITTQDTSAKPSISYNPFIYTRRASAAVGNIGGGQVPIVVADFMHAASIAPQDLKSIGYKYDAAMDKWHIGDAAADYIFLGKKSLDFELPGTLKPVVFAAYHQTLSPAGQQKYIPCFDIHEFIEKTDSVTAAINFVAINQGCDPADLSASLDAITGCNDVVLCISASAASAKRFIEDIAVLLQEKGITYPLVLCIESHSTTVDEQLIECATGAGGPLLDGIGDGIWLMNDPEVMELIKVSGRTYLEVKNNNQFLNNTAFSILQATRTRISKTEYISCPSCGRTLFDLQETTAKIRAATNHLKGVKIAIMGCIVNGPGEMADADFGYVGSGPGKITLYKSKEVVKKNVPSEIAVDELIQLLKDSDVWIEEPAAVA